MNKLFIVVGCSYEEQDNLQIFLCLEEAKEFTKQCIAGMTEDGFQWFSIEMWAPDEEGNWTKYQSDDVGDNYFISKREHLYRAVDEIEDYGIENGRN